VVELSIAPEAFWLYMLVAFVAGVGVTALGVRLIVKKPEVKVYKHTGTFALAALMVGIFAFGEAMMISAQTAVPLEIPTDVIFTETNNWIATFAPIAAIGIGITIALAVLAYLGKMIAGAFKG